MELGWIWNGTLMALLFDRWMMDCWMESGWMLDSALILRLILHGLRVKSGWVVGRSRGMESGRLGGYCIRRRLWLNLGWIRAARAARPTRDLDL